MKYIVNFNLIIFFLQVKPDIAENSSLTKSTEDAMLMLAGLSSRMLEGPSLVNGTSINLILSFCIAKMEE